MAQEVRKHRRAGRLRFRIMPAACLIVTMAVVSTMVQAASGKFPAYGGGIFAGDRSGKRAARGFGRSL